MRRALLLLLPGAIAAACSSFSGDDGASSDASIADASSPTDTGVPPVTEAGGADASEAGTPCVPDDGDGGTTTLIPFRTAVLDPSQADAGANKFCDLAVAVCLLEFDLTNHADRRIASATLSVPRATGTDCNQPSNCADPMHNKPAIVTGANMRTDWKADANYQIGWGAPGASGPLDKAADTVQAMAVASKAAILPFTSSTLDPRFAPTLTSPFLAFRLSGDSVTAPFVIRRSEYALANNPDLPTVDVQFCK